MFKLDFHIEPNKERIKIGDKILMMGSCFSHEMGLRLKECKFEVLSNPFGTLYNPISIFRALELSVLSSKKVDAINHQDIWYDWDAHSTSSALSKSELVEKSMGLRKQTKKKLENASWVVITPGTAIVYTIDDEDRIVANCHKKPSHTFGKRMLLPNEFIDSFGRIHQMVMEINPRVKFLFTVSPVRHIRDGLIENNQSKATLLLAIKHITDTLSNCFYFPSYEILIDELRDYRFYAHDMIHPNELAKTYIWEKFVHSFLDHKAIEWIEKWNRLQKDLQHRPYHPSSPGHQNFLKKLLDKLEKLNSEFDVSKEIEEVKKQIK